MIAFRFITQRGSNRRSEIEKQWNSKFGIYSPAPDPLPLLDRGKIVRWGRRGLRTLRRERNAMQIFTTAGEGRGATHAERDRSKPPHPPNLTRLIGMCLRFLFIRLKLFDILSQRVVPRDSLMDRGYNGWV